MLFYSGYIPRSGNSGCVYIKLCRYFQTVFQSDCTILPSHLQYVWEFKLFHICTNTWHFSFFFKVAILMSIQRYNIMVLIFISLMTNEMEHHFIYWPFGCCLLKCLFKSLAHFSVGLYLPFSHLLVGIFYIYSMWVFCQTYILPVPSLWLLFQHLNGDFWWTEILYFNVVQFTYLPFLLGVFCILFVKILPTPRSSRYSSIFSTNLGL